MAAAFLRQRAGDSIEVRSAGTTPAGEIQPVVREVMAEVGIDLGDVVPKKLEADTVEASDVVITMGCGDACPVFPGVRYLDWELTDPAGRPIEEVRAIRDDIDRRVADLVADLTG
jgi:arsenate reductase